MGQQQQKKKKGLWWTPFGVEWKNAAHPVKRTANWCIGGWGFTLAQSPQPWNFGCDVQGREPLRPHVLYP